MTRTKIKYIGFFDVPESRSDRVCNISATNKMNYIANTLIEAGYEVDIISPSWMGDKTKVLYEMQKTIIIDAFKKVTYCPSWKTNNKITRNIKILISLIWLFLYLLVYTDKGEKVIAYHVQWISLPIRAAKFIRKFDLVLEIEEIYQDVTKLNELFIRWENKLINRADAFVYSNDLLKGQIQTSKPGIVIYGEYKVYEKLSMPNNDGKIHLLYAGIIDEHKKGAFNALEASKYLSDKYVLHIIGFGQIEKLRAKIDNYNTTNRCKVHYDGLKSGDEYIRYCQSCHIGLSTQIMSGEYLESSFPSKILSYLALGLRVVSCEIKCVTESKIGHLITYYSQDEPRAIADAIKAIDISDEYDSSKVIKELHKEFLNSIFSLLME